MSRTGPPCELTGAPPVDRSRHKALRLKRQTQLDEVCEEVFTTRASLIAIEEQLTRLSDATWVLVRHVERLMREKELLQRDNERLRGERLVLDAYAGNLAEQLRPSNGR